MKKLTLIFRTALLVTLISALAWAVAYPIANAYIGTAPASTSYDGKHPIANDVIEKAAAAPLPESASLLLLGMGLIGLAGLCRKRWTNR